MGAVGAPSFLNHSGEMGVLVPNLCLFSRAHFSQPALGRRLRGPRLLNGGGLPPPLPSPEPPKPGNEGSSRRDRGPTGLGFIGHSINTCHWEARRMVVSPTEGAH